MPEAHQPPGHHHLDAALLTVIEVAVGLGDA